MLRDSNPTTYTVRYHDGTITTGHTYQESLDLFNARETNGVSSTAPTTSNTYD